MSEKEIKDSINAIEPNDDAKERMYQNILKKAQQSALAEKPAKSKKKRTPFVRYAVPVAACLCLVVVGLSGYFHNSTPIQPDESYVQSGNPFADVDNADAFKKIGITFEAPSGATDISYTIIDEQIASIHFVMNKKTFEARASAQNGDFSGLTGKVLDAQNIDAKNNATLYTIGGDFETYYKMTWTNGKVNYCLYGTDGATGDEVTVVYNAFAG